jgi:hypothetical protein
MTSAVDTKALVTAVMATSDAERDFLAQIAIEARLVARGRTHGSDHYKTQEAVLDNPARLRTSCQVQGFGR